MKKTLLLCLLLVCAAWCADGQVPADGKWYGVYRMYDFPAYEKVRAPKGYRPVAISHYSRHGARYQDSENAYLKPLEPLLDGRSDGALTPLGESVCERLEIHARRSVDHRGELSRRGWEQQFRNAHLLHNAFPSVVSPEAEITACSSFSQRCMMSMAAFSVGLEDADPRLQVYAVTSRTLLDEVNPGDKANVNYTPTQKKDSPWDLSYDKMLDAAVSASMADSILLRLFKDTDYIRRHIPSPKNYCGSLYNLISGLACTGDGPVVDDLFTEKELFAFYQAINYGFFEWSVLDGDKFKPILRQMAADARADLAAGHPTVRLRFGHDTCLLAILHLLQAGDLGIVPEKAEDLPLTWNCYQTPMAGHFEWVFYRHRKSGDILVLPYLNGSPVPLQGLPAINGHFYSWDDICHRIASL